MEDSMVLVIIYDVDSEGCSPITSFTTPSVPNEGDTLWVDNKIDPLTTSLVKYKVVYREWVLILLSGQSHEIRGLHCELHVRNEHRILDKIQFVLDHNTPSEIVGYTDLADAYQRLNDTCGK